MSTVAIDISVLCACGQPETAPVHGHGGHKYAPIRGVDQVRDDQHLEKTRRHGHSTLAEYRVVTIAKPAAGADWVAAVPATAQWRVQCFQAQLITDAVVANRIPHLVIKDSLGNSVYNFPAPNNQVGGTTAQYSGGTTIVSAFFDNALALVLPYPMRLLANWTIGMVTTGLDPGDQWSNIALHVKEWLQF